MANILNVELRPILERLAMAADKLQAEKAESADQALNGIVERLERSLTGFMTDFRDTITNQTKNEMEGLASQLKEAGTSLATFPAMMDKFKTYFGAITGQFVKAINTAALEGNNLQTQTIGELRTLSGEIRQTMEAFSKTLQVADVQNRHIQAVVENLKAVSGATAAAANDLSGTFKDQTALVTEFISSMMRESEALRNSVATVQSAAQGFGDLDQTLAKTFETLNDGLKKYSEATREGLSGQLEKYAQSITGFADRLAGAVEQVGDLVEDLTAAFESAKRS
jgi:ABC-type transporter Mla subunit MlaD